VLAAPVLVAPPDPLADRGRDALLDEVEAPVRAVVSGKEPDPAEARRPGPGRPRVLSAPALWGGVLVYVLPGQRAVWRLLTASRLWHCPRYAVSD